MKANTGREDLDALIDIRGPRPGEPIFVVFGRDKLAEGAAHDYAARAYQEGCSPALVESALRRADALAAYGPKKLPDISLAPDLVKQATYRLSRRAWNARPTADAREIYAEERAIAACKAALAPLIDELIAGGSWEGSTFTYTPDPERPAPCPISALQRLAEVLRTELASGRRAPVVSLP